VYVWYAVVCADYKAEQADEMEALESIYMENFEVVEENPLAKIRLLLEPEKDYSEEAESEKVFVSFNLLCTFPDTYPDVVPEIAIEPLKGIDDQQEREILQLLSTEVRQSRHDP
jgi:hypothetical protein